jgi:hypothetical protein
MQAAATVSACLDALEAGAVGVGSGRWQIVSESAGHPLSIELSLHGSLLRAEALVLPPAVIEPRQLLFWNAQAPLVCFAENRAGEVLVCGELPVAAVDAELLDRFLGLLHASATRARQFVLRGV